MRSCSRRSARTRRTGTSRPPRCATTCSGPWPDSGSRPRRSWATSRRRPSCPQQAAATGTTAGGTTSSPASGAQVQKGSTVDLSVSGGPDTLTVPNVVGLDEDRARNTLEQAKFTSINSQQVDSLEKKGTVVAVSPVEGSQAAPNSPIRLQISTGTVPLPNVSNKSEDEARRILTQAGFRAGQIVNQNVERDDVPAGTVVGTEP